MLPNLIGPELETSIILITDKAIMQFSNRRLM